MDEEARRYYDIITNGLKAESQEGIFTRHQIDKASVFYWGNTLTDYRNERESALKANQATTDDPAEREQATDKINAYFADKEEAFNRSHDAAVTELYRENGIPVEDKELAELTFEEYLAAKKAQTVDVYPDAARELEQQKAEKQEKSRAEILQDKAHRPEITGRFGDDKGRREQTFEEYQAAKKEKEEKEKEAEKYTPELRPTQEQTRRLTPRL